jgi:CubicO group peptidase (beta-lactamase class C family)
MSRPWYLKAFAVIAAGVALILAFVAGLFIYVNATATPLHPDAQSVRSTAPSAPLPKWTAAAEQARQIARTAVSRQNLPGLSVAVGANGDVVWAEGFGEADLEKKTPVTPQTRFRIGDVSVTLTSAAVGLLYEKNQLNLDSDIQRYVPEFPEKQWPVTLRQLMSHQAGVRNDAGDEEQLSEACARTADGLKRFADSPLRFEPGSQVRVSSYGWILVSAAVEAAANQPFFAFMQKQIFEPLGMTATTPYISTEQTPDLPTFYFPRFGGDTRYGPELAREGDHACFAGAAAFLSTPSDLVRFGMAIGRGSLLKPATVDLLQTSQRLTSGDDSGYGLGWRIETVPLAGQPAKLASYGSKPDFIGGSASILTFPERGLVVVVTSNTSFGDAKSIALAIAEAFAAPAAR